MKMKTKIISMGVIVTILPIAVMLVLIAVQKQKLSGRLSKDIDQQLRNQLQTVAKDVYALCQTQNESVEQTLEANLNVARDVLRKKGEVTLSSDKASWTAKNQLSGAIQNISLPKLLVGGQWLGQSMSLRDYVPVIDDTVKMVGATCTIFQRMDNEGNMLRVATNVKAKDGSRAIGTFIPARNPDGSPNAVVSKVLNGSTYKGRAFVVDSWYLAAYEPLRDATGSIIGMLYVGVKQENVLSFRQAIVDIKIGATGYVYVLGGSGEAKGQYLISKDGKRDGENIWDSKDADGKPFIQDMINQALKTKKAEVFFYEYQWKNPEDPVAKKKIAAVTYFAPWDWVIGAGAYEEDISTAKVDTNASLANLLWSSIGVGFVVMLLAVLFSFFIGIGIARPITKICEVADRIATGDIDQEVEYRSKDEFGELAKTFTKMTASLKQMVVKLRKTADKVSSSAEMVSASSEQVNASAQEVSGAIQKVNSGASTQAERVSETFGIMEKSAISLKQVVVNAQDTSAMVNKATSKAEEGKIAAKEAVDKIGHLADTVLETTRVIQNLGQMSQQIGEITETITSIADQTNLLALNAAIEAARAGEAGRGFAVVAEEVRKLAEGSAEAVRKIGGLIKSIQGDTSRAVAAIETGSREVQEGKSQVARIAEVLDEITNTIKSANTLANQIAHTSQERVSEVERVVKAINEISSIAKTSVETVQQVSATSEEQSASMQEMAASAQELSRLATDLKEVVSQFKVKGTA